MIYPQPTTQKRIRLRLLLLTLLLGYFLTFTFAVFLNNSIVNVAASLNVTVGTTSQVLTACSFMGLIVGVFMGFLTVRFIHRSLFLLGVAFFSIGTIGSFFAPDFESLLFFSFFIGIGTTMTSILVFALIGDSLSLEKKGMAVGLATATAFFANLVMPQVTSAIINAADWRAVLLWFIFPISIVVSLFAFFVLPSKPLVNQTIDKPDYLKAFKHILQNKSALSCMIVASLISVSFLSPIYAISFFTLFFKEPLTMGATFYSLAQ
jgi:MFS family permease